MGVQDGSHKYYLQIFFERVSCSPRWPPTGYLGKDDPELLLSPPPKGWNPELLLLGELCPPTSSSTSDLFFLSLLVFSLCSPA